MVGAIVVAAGRGLRAGRTDKILMMLGGRSIIDRSVAPFLEDSRIGQIVIVTPEGREAEFLQAAFPEGFPSAIAVRAVKGGERRQDSVANGLDALHAEVDFVAVHDAARPLHRVRVLSLLIDTAMAAGAAVPVISPADTVVPIDSASGTISGILDRSTLRLAQTPQVFRRDWLVAAHDKGRSEGLAATDDASLVRLLGHPVATVTGSNDNLKITTGLDFLVAETMLKEISG